MQNEVEILTALIPKTGFSLEALCASSYGVNPRILLAIVGFTLESVDSELDLASMEGAGKGRVLSALESNLKKVLFIRERSLNLEGAREKWDEIEILLADQTVSRWKRDDTMGSQHAKFILAVYKNDKGQRYGRLYVGSKNFTAGSCKELGVVMDLVEGKVSGKTSFHGQLLRFLEKCIEPELIGANRDKNRVFETLSRAIKKSKLGPAVSNVDFLFQTRHSKERKLWAELVTEAQGAKRIDIHSPWADPSIVEELSKKSGQARLHVKCLKDSRFKYTNLPHLTLHFDGLCLHGKLYERQSHAKAFLFGHEKSKTLLFGSANMTASGLGISKTPNTEILLRWRGSEKDFKPLLCQGPGTALDDTEAAALTPTEQEIIQQELFAVDIDLKYSESKKSLIYRLGNLPKMNFVIRHLLLEPVSSGEQKYVDLPISKKSNGETHIEIASSDLKRFSSLVILRAEWKGELIEADRNVDLPPQFYDARIDLKALRAFRLSGDQLIQELLNLADFPVSGGSGGAGNGESNDLQLWVQWLSRVHLERLALRLFKMKKNDPVLFLQRQKRLERVIGDLEKSEVKEFHALAKTLREVSDVLVA